MGVFSVVFTAVFYCRSNLTVKYHIMIISLEFGSI